MSIATGSVFKRSSKNLLHSCNLALSSVHVSAVMELRCIAFANWVVIALRRQVLYAVSSSSLKCFPFIAACRVAGYMLLKNSHVVSMGCILSSPRSRSRASPHSSIYYRHWLQFTSNPFILCVDA